MNNQLTDEVTYAQDFSEQINSQMMVPRKITVGDGDHGQPQSQITEMYVPDRIVLNNSQESSHQFTPQKTNSYMSGDTVSMESPPRVITMNHFKQEEELERKITQVESVHFSQEVINLQEKVAVLKSKLSSVEEECKQVSKMSLLLIGISLAFSIVNSISLLRRK